MRILIFVVVFLSLGHISSADSFNERVVRKLATMLKVSAPSSIKIEVLSQDKMLEKYRTFFMENCVMGMPERIPMCMSQLDSTSTFVYGMWLRKQDVKELHILLYEKAGIEALIHEYMHFYLDSVNVSLNNHTVLLPMVDSIVTSREFVSWLKEEEK